MAELVDALDSKSSSFESAGSIPAQGTKRDKLAFESVCPVYLSRMLIEKQMLERLDLTPSKVVNYSNRCFPINSFENLNEAFLASTFPPYVGPLLAQKAKLIFCINGLLIGIFKLLVNIVPSLFIL